MRRPAYLISSTMFIEDADDERIGEVQQEWRPLKRCYNLFLGNEQFARIESPFLAWEFVLRDAQGSPLALIDRNFSGFGRELFTDAGRYAIHFGETPEESARFVQRSIDAAHPNEKGIEMRAPVVPGTTAVIPFSSGAQLVLKDPLDFDERLIALAAVRFEALAESTPPLSRTHALHCSSSGHIHRLRLFQSPFSLWRYAWSLYRCSDAIAVADPPSGRRRSGRRRR